MNRQTTTELKENAMFKLVIAIVLSAGLLFAMSGCSSSQTAYSSQADHQFLKDYADNPMDF